MVKRLVGGIVLLATFATVLLAHDLFLKLNTYFVPPGATVRVAVLNGTFAKSEGSVTPDRLRDLSLVGPAGRRDLPRGSWQPLGDTTWLTLTAGTAGTYVIGASLLPREIKLGAADFNAYLKEDGIPDVLDARTRSGELKQPARERYQKHVKAVLQVGDTTSDAFATVLGYPAELVPLTNPYALHRGDTLALRCLVDGNPVAGQLVIAGAERVGIPMPEVSARSDSAGVVRFALGVRGKWYVKFIHMVPSTVPGDSVNYESKWATITFEIR